MADTTPRDAAHPDAEQVVPAQASGHRTRRIVLSVGAALLAVTLLALAIGSQGGSSGDSGSPMPTADTPAEGADSAGSRSADEYASDLSASEQASDFTNDGAAAGAEGPSIVDVPLEDRAVIRTGSLTLTSTDVATARRHVLNAIEALGGYVADEQSRADDDGGLRLTDLSLAVPTGEFGTAIERAADAGTVTGRTQSARDVTEQVVDVETRVASAEASLRRIRLLLGRAESLGDVIRLEQVLSSRQADLESLQAQQQSLAARTDLASLQVTIAVPPKKAEPTPEPEEEAAGFFPGLSRGWDALASGYVTLATAAGTALPTLLVLGLLALLVRWITRRVRRNHPTAAAPA